jgi:thiamine phosphate synthase YjbQ (UPF0047 family)
VRVWNQGGHRYSTAGFDGGHSTIESNPSRGSADVFEELAPRDGEYRHHLQGRRQRLESREGSAARAFRTVPVTAGELMLGTWQQIALFELDTQARMPVVVQVLGE